MRFGKQVRLFSCDGINMVGNLDTGVVIGVDENGFRLCKSLANGGLDISDVQNADGNLVAHLRAGGFFEKVQKRRRSIVVYLHVTNHCNLDCESCYSWTDHRNSMCDLTTEEEFRIIDNIGALRPSSLIISGGEPFLRADLALLASRARSVCPGCNITVLTNGIGLSERAISDVGSCVDSISVSVDGYDKRCASYIRKRHVLEEVEETISFINRTPAKAHIIPTIHAKNVRSLHQYIHLADKLGASISFSLLSCPSESSISKGLCFSDGSLKDLADQLIEVNKPSQTRFESTSLGIGMRYVCDAGRTIVSISADGTVFPCHMLHTDGFAMGSALIDPIRNLLLTGGLFPEGTTADQIEGCSGCQYAYLCGGGCRSRAIVSGGGLQAKDPYCSLMKRYFSKTLHSLSLGTPDYIKRR